MLPFQLSSYTHIREMGTLHFIGKWDTKIKENYLSDIRTDRSNPRGIVRYLTKTTTKCFNLDGCLQKYQPKCCQFAANP